MSVLASFLFVATASLLTVNYLRARAARARRESALQPVRVTRR